MAITQYFGTGRRKKSVARVRLIPGKGEITINKRTIDDYFGLETLKVIANTASGRGSCCRCPKRPSQRW